MDERIPLLIFSDAVSAPTGLARITRDVASRVHSNLADVFKVATIGYGGSSSSKYPWHQYAWTYNDEWIIHDLPEVWEDFAGVQRGVFMSIQDAGRMTWLSRPEACSDEVVKRFLMRRPFAKWGYFPIDATGPNNRLSLMLRHTLLGYDRVLTYTKWAEEIVLRTLGISGSDDRQLWNVPHGIDTKVFHPRGRQWRQMFGQLYGGFKTSIANDEVLVGIVATNQARKDFGLAFEVLSKLQKQHKLRLWIHTDILDRHWSLPYLITDYGLTTAEHVLWTGVVDDDTMAKAYSACDLTLAIGNGEGFGYPIFESLACGVPVVHGNYGGAPEYMPATMLVPPAGFRTEGVFSSRRAVYDAGDWEVTCNSWINRPHSEPESLLSSALTWERVWPLWESWFKKGVKHVEDKSRDSDASVARMA